MISLKTTSSFFCFVFPKTYLLEWQSTRERLFKSADSFPNDNSQVSAGREVSHIVWQEPKFLGHYLKPSQVR